MPKFYCRGSRNPSQTPFIPLETKILRILEAIGKDKQITFRELKNKLEATWRKPVKNATLLYCVYVMSRDGLLRNTARGVYAHRDFRFCYELPGGKIEDAWTANPIDAKAEIKAWRTQDEQDELKELLS